MRLFSDYDDRFIGRVVRYGLESKDVTIHGEPSSLREYVCHVEAIFNLDIFDLLHKPHLIGVERLIEGEEWYLIFEVVNVRAWHLEKGAISPDVPPTLKWSVLERIDESWIKGGENWMEVVAVHTGYRIRERDDEIEVVRDVASPLIGARAHIMSSDVYSYLVFKRVDTSADIGILRGYSGNALIDVEALMTHHTGIFGFTGTGKSNLVSLLVRRLLDKVGDVRVLVFDIAGEYPFHLIDLLALDGVIYTVEEVDREGFTDSIVIPETFKRRYGDRELDSLFKKVLNERVGIERIDLTSLNPVEFLERFIAEALSQKSVNLDPYALVSARRLESLLKSIPSEMELDRFRDEIVKMLDMVGRAISQRSAIHKNLAMVKQYLNRLDEFPISDLTLYKILYRILYGEHPRLSIFHLPDILTARYILSQAIQTIFKIRKRYGKGYRVLFVIDEAHEFIPAKTSKDDRTEQSNKSVELLLRQGRKYGIGGWIATQRIAHLNTNALQQLHSYFISTMPREYDRRVIADAFSISKSIVDKVTMLGRGEWLFVSYIATKYPGIPVEFKAYNNEDIVAGWLSDISKEGYD